MFFLYKGHQVYYNVFGKGAPVVLLHGYLESSEIWDSFADKLSVEFRVITVDLPGHGHSEIFGTVHTMEFMATVIKELLENLNIQKAFICGHSLGGYVALAFLELFPERMSGYLLFHSHPFADSPEAIENRNREIKLVQKGMKDRMYPANVIKMFATSNLEKFSEAIQRSKEISSRIPGDGIICVLRGMISRPSRLDLIEKGIVPCLWILGSMDNYIPCNEIQEKVKLPSNAKVVVLKKSGHLGFVEEEAESVRLISEFVNNIF